MNDGKGPVEEFLHRSRSRNDKLEKLRNDIPGPPDITPVLTELRAATSNIHVGWLLDPAGKNACQLLSLGLDCQQPGWERLAHKLGIQREIIQDIQRNSRLKEGETYTVLRIYAEKDEATIERVITILHELERHDLVGKLKDAIIAENGLLAQLRLENSGLIDSGYSSASDVGSSEDFFGRLTKPPLPPLPNKYREFNVSRVRMLTENYNRRTERESLIRQCRPINPDYCVERTSPQQSYGSVIMLTFASDGINCAERVAASLRRQRDGKPRIGVLILDENRDRLSLNPFMYITNYFQQVNYIVPILTYGYLDAVVGISEADDAFSACLDAYYVKLIYKLMSDSYIHNGCLNTRVRCIVPADADVWKHPAARKLPLLQVWLPEHDLEYLAEAALK